MVNLTTCPICLEIVLDKLLITGIVSTCCATSICRDCAAEFNNGTVLSCQNCKLNIELNDNSVDNAVIQSSLHQQGEDLLALLQSHGRKLQKTLTEWTRNQTAFLSNLADLTALATTPALRQQLVSFHHNQDKQLQIERVELTQLLNQVEIRSSNLSAWLQRDKLPLIIMAISQEWSRQLRLNDYKVSQYKPHCLYRHPEASGIIDDSDYLLLPRQYGVTLLKRQVDQRWCLNKPSQAFLAANGTVVLYTESVAGGNFAIDLLDLNDFIEVLPNEVEHDDLRGHTSLTLNIPIRGICYLETVVPISEGYIVVYRHSGQINQIMMRYFDNSGICKSCEPVKINNLVQVVVYYDKVIIFGGSLIVYAIINVNNVNNVNNVLTKLASVPLKQKTYSKFWRNNLVYFRNDDNHHDGKASYYRFDLDRGDNWTTVSADDMQLIYFEDIVPQLSRDLAMFTPMILPGLIKYWGPNGLSINELRNLPYMLVSDDDIGTLLGNIVPIPDLWGRVYRLVE